MSEIVQFPGAELPPTSNSELDEDRVHAEAFRDLESKICECAHMAKIAAQMMVVAPDFETNQELVFAVVHASEMIDTLKVDYYAAYHGEKPIEP